MLVPAHRNGTPVAFRRSVHLLGFTKLVRTLPMPLISYRRFIAGEELGIHHNIADDAWRIIMPTLPRNLTRSAEVREREPYVGLPPFVSPRYPCRFSSCTTDSAASRLLGKLKQVSSGMILAAPDQSGGRA